MSRCSSPRAWLVTSSVSLRRPGPSAATSRTTGGPAVAERVAGSAPTAPSALAFCPRMRSTTRRALRGATLALRALASAEGAVGAEPATRSATAGPPVVLDVAAEGPGRRKLTELVTNHALGDEHRDMLTPVVHGDGVAEHVRDHSGPPGPGLDDVLGALVVLHVHPLEQVVVDERPLLQAARHRLPNSLQRSQRFLLILRRRRMRSSLGLRRRVRPSGLPAGFTGCRPPEVLPSPPQ